MSNATEPTGNDMNSKKQAIWTAQELAAATAGQLQGKTDWRATGVSIDTRTLEAGDLFIALKGENNDGHDYIGQAFDKGAAAVMISDAARCTPDQGAALVVRDTFTALQDLGRAARQRSAAAVIGVTGSVGKTGTKEMLAKAFGALGQTYASRKSYNNDIGVPLSLANMHDADDFGVFEIGMNHPGEITPLSDMVRPHIAIITTVAPVHMENFNSVEEVAAAKAEIFDGMSEGGTAVLNRENDWFDFLKQRAVDKGLKVLSFGEDEACDARLVSSIEAVNGSRVKAEIGGQIFEFNLQIPGRHIVMNALAVLLAVWRAGGDSKEDVKKAARALETLQPMAGRGLQEYLDIGDPDNPVTLIDESYNASPVAMKAAFRVLAMIDPGRGGRRIAVLGDMLELGAGAEKAHRDLALPLETADVQLVYTCGPLMKNLYDALPQDRRGAHKPTSRELAKIVPDVLTPGDVVMVKGSNSSKMDTVVEALRALPGKLARKDKP